MICEKQLRRLPPNNLGIGNRLCICPSNKNPQAVVPCSCVKVGLWEMNANNNTNVKQTCSPFMAKLRVVLSYGLHLEMCNNNRHVQPVYGWIVNYSRNTGASAVDI